MTTYEIIMIMLTCLTLIISLLTLVVRLLLIIIDKNVKKKTTSPSWKKSLR
ncbi:putative holin-like toxin [uncultured Catenibacterium sp.]|uniref:putative holin-like toxin n=1 Tax=uncultured Catenibacterium sp. TaxID=286142 RepID=UPI0025E7C510|nr:putative holin-like toxin [uncultured Catenibacterium sp.]